MVLEATMIVFDSSDYMRNGDYLPTRFDAQIETGNVIFSAKTRGNPESTVGVMSMSGDVKTTFVNDIGKFLAGVRDMKITGTPRFAASIQVAALALKHRQNKNQRQRIVVFVGSPIQDDERALVQLAKKMKKINIAVDIVSFGQEADNEAKLQRFLDTVNSNFNSHLVTVPPGPHLLSDIVRQSPILRDGDSDFGGFAEGGLGADMGEDADIELAMRLSMEDEQRRQAAAAAEAAAEAAAATAGPDGAEGAAAAGEGTAETGEANEANETNEANEHSAGTDEMDVDKK